MIEELTIQKKWFVGEKVEMKRLEEGYDGVVRVSSENVNPKGYKNLADIPIDLSLDSVIFQAYQFEYQGKLVNFAYVKQHEDLEIIEEAEYNFFDSEEEAKEFKKRLIEEMKEHYWDDESERVP
jgi:hypothetical protein